MDAEEVSKTFYCRTEYAAFKDAYRTHRDTRDWCRSNDVLPCNCDSCQDDLVKGVYEEPSSAWGSAEEPANDDNGCLSTERQPCSPDHPVELDVALQEINGEQGSSAELSTERAAEENEEEAPPSPVGAVFEGSDEDEVLKTSDGEDGEEADGRGGAGAGAGCHARRNTWNSGNACKDGSSGGDGGSAHKRGSSWDGGSTSIQQAVEKHGVEYAYKTLRLQGFSDKYIRTHFLPEENPRGSMR